MSQMFDSIFYFGCWKESGHYLWNNRFVKMWQHSPYLPDDFPTRADVIDMVFLPNKINPSGEQGIAYLTHINGWTVIAFLDRSQDSRGASNSAFLMRGLCDFDKALGRAKKAFPAIFERFNFEVKQAETKPLKGE